MDSRGPTALTLAVFRVAANEQFHEPRVAALILQAAEGRGRRALRWIRKHSPRVLGDDPKRPCVEGNCLWTRNLMPSCDAPRGLLIAGRTRAQVVAWWDAARRASCEELWQRTADYVSGRDPWRPCPEAPYSYAGIPLDLVGAMRRGLEPIGCDAGGKEDGFRLARGGR